MKIQNTPILQLNNKTQNSQKESNSHPAFKGGEVFTQALNFFQTNQAFGATFVDAAFMCIPRTVIDFRRPLEPDKDYKDKNFKKNLNIPAGTETAIREFSSNINDAALGAYGVGAALILAQGLNKKYGVAANKMFVDNDTLDLLAGIRNKSGDIKQPENLNKYLEETFDNASGFNPHVKESNTKGWVKIDPKTKTSVINKLKEILSDSSKTKEQIKEAEAHVKALLVRSTGAETEFKLGKSVSSVDEFIDNLYKVSKAFMNDKVAETFKSGNVSNNTFIKGLKKLNLGTAILGITACSLVGASTQPINMYLTKKRTGKSGFVGGGEVNNSTEFKILKFGVATVAALAVLATISTSPSKILSKIQFKGFVPKIDQFKFVYGITLVSRLLSARNENELRESSIKDSLGFANWLILGGFASKLVAAGFEKMSKFKENGVKFIKYNADENGKGWFNWLTKSSIVTREEVLHEALKNKGLKIIKNGKALTFKEMLEAATKHAPEARTKIKYLGLIQIAGYLWSGLALGICIPKLNIAITSSIEKKKKAQEENNAQVQKY